MKGWIEWGREHFGPPLAGILFWCIASLMVVMSAASAKNSVLRDFVSGFGSLAQVALAFAVWRISRDQFNFTKSFNERQLRLMSFPEKFKMLQRYKELAASLTPNNISDDAIDKMFTFLAELRTIYTSRTYRMVVAYTEAAQAVMDHTEEYAERIALSESHVVEYRQKLKVLRKNLRHTRLAAYQAVYNETAIEMDDDLK
jgi:hypothetical protein